MSGQSSDDIDMVDVNDENDLSQITNITLRQRYGQELINEQSHADFDESYYSKEQNGVHIANGASREEIDAGIFLVIDTNFILSHLYLLNELQSLHGKYNNIYRIIIPRQVIQELDGLKSSAKVQEGIEIGQLSRSAIDWCYKFMHNTDPIVKGQKIYECINKNAMKDDSILDCCLYLQRKHPQCLVVLMSNDKNLCVKALTNDILTISYRRGMTAEIIASRVTQEYGLSVSYNVGEIHSNPLNFDPNMKESSTSQNNYESVQRDNYHEADDSMSLDEETEINAPDNSLKSNDSGKCLEDVCQDIFNQVQVLVFEAIDFAVKKAFGKDADMTGYDESKLHTLKDAAYLIKDLSLSTFADYFPTRATFSPLNILNESTNVKRLSSLPNTQESLKEFKEFWTGFLLPIYKKRDPKLQSDLNSIINVWNTWEHNLN